MPKEEVEIQPPGVRGPKGKGRGAGIVSRAPGTGVPGEAPVGRGRPASGTVSSSMPNSLGVPTATTTGTTGAISALGAPLGTQAPSTVPGSTNTTTIAPPSANLTGVTSMATHNSLPPQVVPPTTGYHAQPALDAQTAVITAPQVNILFITNFQDLAHS